MRKAIKTIAGISLFAILASCEGPSANFFAKNPLAAGSDVTSFDVKGGKFTLAALPGYCIENKLTKTGPVGHLVIFGSCSRVADGAKGIRLPKTPVIMSTHVSRAMSAIGPKGFTQAAIEFGQSAKGSSDFLILDRDVSDAVVYLDAEYSQGSPLPGTENRVVIAIQSVNGHTVTHTIFRVSGSGVSQAQAAKIAKSLAKKTKAVN